MMTRIVTLTTDFGTADGYSGAMKGRILSLAPEARIVDISHEIAPQDIRQGAWCLRRAVPAFPVGTLHVAVVDPGVGSQRRGIVVETDRFLLVGPDNGLLMLAAEGEGIRTVRAIDPERGTWRRDATFEGLALFAPVAGYLAAGSEPDSIGPLVETWERLSLPAVNACENCIEGEVILHDRFGNAITNLSRAMVYGPGGEPGQPSGRTLARIEAAGRVAAPCHHYGDLAGAPDSLGALWNSDGHLELFVHGGSARERAHLERGTVVRAFPGTR